jgi:uncharacterized protein
MAPGKVILTKKEAIKLLNAQKLGQTSALLSFDLGKTSQNIVLTSEFAIFGEEKVLFEELKKIKDDACYVLEEGELKKIEFFGEDTNLYYKLKPTKDWPTVMLSSVPMHRFRHFSPKEDTLTKIKEISPVRGTVLDTCCGLGYTAIGAAGFDAVEKVIVFEKDKNMLRVCEYNPYSEALFSNKKIEIMNENVFEGIKSLESNSFDRIIHDPPTVSFAPELYSDEFYVELNRVLKRRGVLYHYCPSPGKTKGKEFWRTIEKMLERNKFVDIKYHEKSSGIRAIKK